jgi:hypothetical protein
MDKNKKKITSAFFIMLIIVVLAVTGYYVINKKITQDAADEVKLPNTEYGKLLAKDLDTAYPKTPTEVVKLYWRFNQCMYNLSNSEFEGLLKQLRRLYDDEFLSHSDNSWDKMLKNFKLDKKKYKSNKQKISSYIVQDNDDVKFGEEKGKECAILYTNTLVKKGSDRVRLYEKFMCRKDSSGNWKILGWSNAAKEGKKYFDNSEE